MVFNGLIFYIVIHLDLNFNHGIGFYVLLIWKYTENMTQVDPQCYN